MYENECGWGLLLNILHIIQVNCEGYGCLAESRLQRLNVLEVIGEEALNGAMIISDVKESNGDRFVAYMNGM